MSIADKAMKLKDGKILYDDLRTRIENLPTDENIIMIQDTQPSTEGNRIWITETPPSSVQVPTVSEMNTAIAGCVSDVQLNSTSVVSSGVANIPVANYSTFGVIKIGDGVYVNSSGALKINRAVANDVKAGTDDTKAIVPNYQHSATFYGLAKAAGNTDQSSSSNAVGVYTEDALSKISDMLNAPVSVSGSTPSITAKAGVRYICGEVSTLSVTAPASGCIDVVFESGSTATVLTVTSAKTGVSAIKWAGSFDPTSLDANTTYEINIMDGEYGVVGKWT